MKIAFIKQKYVDFGGGEGYLSGLMSLCAQQGHDVHLIATHWESNIDNSAIQFHPVSINKLTRATRVNSFAHSVKNCVDNNNFDCIFSSERTISQQVWRGGDGVYPAWLKRRTLFEPWHKSLFNKYSAGQRAVLTMEERCVRSTPYLIANSNMVRDDLLEAYPRLQSSIDVIHNGYDPLKFSLSGRKTNRLKIREQYNIDHNRPLIGFVGSNWLRKGLRPLLQALALLPEVMLIVAGRDNADRWQQLAKKIGVDQRVLFVGGITDVASLYHALDVSVLASWSDSFGFVGLESIACGTPYVTTLYAGSHECIQKGINGYTVARPDQTEELATAINDALMLKSTEAIAETIRDWTVANNMQKTLQVLTRAASEK